LYEASGGAPAPFSTILSRLLHLNRRSGGRWLALQCRRRVIL